MKKTEIFCDDCKKPIKISSRPLDDDRAGLNWGSDIDICVSCERTRIIQSLKDYPIGSLTCPKCNNTKKIRVRVGVNDNYEMRPEYENQVCQVCKHGIRLGK